MVWFLCLMAYQPFWVIQCQCYPCRRTTVILYNPKARGNKRAHAFPKGISLKVNVNTCSMTDVWTC